MAFDFNLIKSNVEGMIDKLEEFLVSKTVVGEQIQVGNNIIIPFVSIGFGAGTGIGDGQDEKKAGGMGGGGGIGAKVQPIAVLVINGDDVRMIPVKKSGGLEKLIEMVPDLISKISPADKDKDEDKENEDEDELRDV